jgi:hypothetical protein
MVAAGPGRDSPFRFENVTAMEYVPAGRFVDPAKVDRLGAGGL